MYNAKSQNGLKENSHFNIIEDEIIRTLNISISQLEYNKFGIKTDKLSFSDFIDIVSKELTRQNLGRSIKLAEKYGLSRLTVEDITKEVSAVRKNAKN